MFQPYNTLPDDYEMVKAINFVKNTRFALLINILSLILFFVGVIVLTVPKGGFSYDLFQILIVIGLLIPYIIIHELIHGLFFKINLKEKKVIYRFHGIAASAGVPDVYFQKGHFLLVSIAPFLITALVLMPFLFFVNDYWYTIVAMLAAANLAGSAGDLYLFVKLIFMDRRVLIEDYGPGMNFFLPKKDQ